MHGEVGALRVGVGEGGCMRHLGILGGSGGRVPAAFMVGTMAADSESSAELSQKGGAEIRTIK